MGEEKRKRIRRGRWRGSMRRKRRGSTMAVSWGGRRSVRMALDLRNDIFLFNNPQSSPSDTSIVMDASIKN